MSGDHDDHDHDEHHHDGGIAQEVRAVTAALEARGIVRAGDLERILDRMGTPLQGARVVARAWVDGEYRARLLADGNAGVEELGYSMGGGPMPQLLRVVANDEGVHNVVVC